MFVWFRCAGESFGKDREHSIREWMRPAQPREYGAVEFADTVKIVIVEIGDSLDDTLNLSGRDYLHSLAPSLSL
jgi:hypothetical protein